MYQFVYVGWHNGYDLFFGRGYEKKIKYNGSEAKKSISSLIELAILAKG